MKFNKKITFLKIIGLIIPLMIYVNVQNKDYSRQKQTFSLEDYQVYIDDAKEKNIKDKTDKISNYEEAAKVAESFFVDKYGKEILKERPWIAKYDDSTKSWLLEGTLHCPVFRTCVGGVATMIVDERGNVIAYWHGK